jgi:hypothetical protein
MEELKATVPYPIVELTDEQAVLVFNEDTLHIG